MNSCVVLVFGPEVAKVRVPRAFVVFTGSSLIGGPLGNFLGSPLIPTYKEKENEHWMSKDYLNTTEKTHHT